MRPFEEQLRDESAGWVSDGLVTAEQRAALLARHPETEGGGRLLGILAAVGGALVLAGVCLLIGSNWQVIGDWTKILGLLALLVGANYAGWRLQVAPGRWPRLGDTCFMVGAGLFLAGIALVSQIFHLNARPATGVLVWWLGIAAVPWLTGSKGAQFLSTGALLTWLGWEMNTPGSWIELAHRRYSYGPESQFFCVIGLLALAVWLGGLALRGTRHERFAGLHEKWGAAIACFGIYLLGFARHEGSWRYGGEIPPLAVPPLALGGVVVGLTAWGAWRRSPRELRGLAPWLAAALVPALAVYFQADIGDGGRLWSVLAWVALFGLNLAMIHAGLATGRAGWVNLGIGFIALNILTRYFDLFSTMLQGGLFFILSGALVLAVGISLERKRRALLRELRAKNTEGKP
jgi:uncharacterized membrane protein